MSFQRWLGFTVVMAMVLAAPEAFACPVCFSPNNEANRVAFEWSTFFLSVIPLAFLGCGVGWLWRRSKQLDREALADESAQTTSVTPGAQEQAV